MRFFTVSILSALAALVSATTTLPDYSVGPSGNPILYPGLNEQVPVGIPYQIQWTPTTTGTVSIWLLRGPSTNVQPIATLATSIPNLGEFTWIPSTTLQDDTTHYGLIIIVDGTGQYQYSTQFGIKNDAVASSSSSAVASSSTAAITTSSSASVSVSVSIPVSSSTVSSASSISVVASTTHAEAVETTSTSSASAVEKPCTSSASAVETTATSSASAVETATVVETTATAVETTATAVETTATAVETTSTAVQTIPTGTVISVYVPTLAPSATPVTPTTLASSFSIPKASVSPSPSVLATFSGAADLKTPGFGAVAVAAGLVAVFAF